MPIIGLPSSLPLPFQLLHHRHYRVIVLHYSSFSEIQQTSCINIAIKQWHAPDACLQINL